MSYKVKVKGTGHSHKLQFFCPNCKKITSNLDDKYLLEFGFCWECHTMHVADRQVPTIDLEKYKRK